MKSNYKRRSLTFITIVIILALIAITLVFYKPVIFEKLSDKPMDASDKTAVVKNHKQLATSSKQKKIAGNSSKDRESKILKSKKSGEERKVETQTVKQMHKISSVAKKMIEISTDMNFVKLSYKDAISRIERAGVVLKEAKNPIEFGGNFLYFKGKSTEKEIVTASMTYDKVSDEKFDFVRLEFKIDPKLTDLETVSNEIHKNLKESVIDVVKYKNFYGYKTRNGMIVGVKKFSSDSRTEGEKEYIHVTLEYVMD